MPSLPTFLFEKAMWHTWRRAKPEKCTFNFQPDRAYPIRVQSIAPKSETLERIGAVFRVTGFVR